MRRTPRCPEASVSSLPAPFSPDSPLAPRPRHLPPLSPPRRRSRSTPRHNSRTMAETAEARRARASRSLRERARVCAAPPPPAPVITAAPPKPLDPRPGLRIMCKRGGPKTAGPVQRGHGAAKRGHPAETPFNGAGNRAVTSASRFSARSQRRPRSTPWPFRRCLLLPPVAALPNKPGRQGRLSGHWPRGRLRAVTPSGVRDATSPNSSEPLIGT
jgi:hypothetical protein